MYCPKNDFYLHLNLIDRVPEEPWMEVHDIVQEAMIKTIPKKKKHKNAKWLSEEALQIAEKEEKLKAKEKRKDITIWMQCSKEQQGEIRKPSSVINSKKQENNRIGKTRDLFKKIRDTKGIFHAKTDTVKDRNGMDLTEAGNIKKRW